MISINVRHHLMIALGRKDFLWEYIDQLYEERKWEYYQAYQKGEFKEDCTKTTYTAQTEEHIIKVMSMNDWCEQNNNYDIIDKLIKKGFKKVYNYFKNSSSISIDNWYMERLRKSKSNMDNIVENDLFDEIFVLMFLAHNNKKPIKLGRVEPMISRYLDNINRNIFGRIQREKLIAERKEKDKYWEEHVLQVYNDIGIDDKFFKEPVVLDVAIKKIINEMEIYIYKKSTGRPLLKNGVLTISQNEYEELRTKVFNEGCTRYIGNLTQFITLMGFNEESLTKTKIAKNDMDLIIGNYLISIDNGQILKEDKFLYIISELWLYNFTTLYKQLKKLYLEDTKAREYADILERENLVKIKEDNYNKKVYEMQLALSKKDEQLTAFEKESKEKDSQIKQLKAREKQLEDNFKEVLALRKFVYNQNKLQETIKEISYQDKIHTINNKKIAIFGGHPTLHKNLKEKFPDIRCISPESINIDFSFIDNLDYVLIYTDYLCHSMYRKLMSKLRNNAVHIFYVNETNLTIFINSLYIEIINDNK